MAGVTARKGLSETSVARKRRRGGAERIWTYVSIRIDGADKARRSLSQPVMKKVEAGWRNTIVFVEQINVCGVAAR